MPLFGESLMFETLDASGEVDCPYKLEIPVFGESLMFDTLWMPQAKDKRGGCTSASIRMLSRLPPSSRPLTPASPLRIEPNESNRMRSNLFSRKRIDIPMITIELHSRSH